LYDVRRTSPPSSPKASFFHVLLRFQDWRSLLSCKISAPSTEVGSLSLCSPPLKLALFLLDPLLRETPYDVALYIPEALFPRRSSLEVRLGLFLYFLLHGRSFLVWPLSTSQSRELIAVPSPPLCVAPSSRSSFPSSAVRDSFGQFFLVIGLFWTNRATPLRGYATSNGPWPDLTMAQPLGLPPHQLLFFRPSRHFALRPGHRA